MLIIKALKTKQITKMRPKEKVLLLIALRNDFRNEPTD